MEFSYDRSRWKDFPNQLNAATCARKAAHFLEVASTHAEGGDNERHDTYMRVVEAWLELAKIMQELQPSVPMLTEP